MHRTQVLLEPWQFELLRHRAAARGTSVAALIRDMVDRDLAGPTHKERLAALRKIRGIYKGPPIPEAEQDDIIYGA